MSTTQAEQVLAFLDRHGGSCYRIDGRLVPMLAAELQTSQATVSTLLRHMRNDGLIETKATRGFGTTWISRSFSPPVAAEEEAEEAEEFVAAPVSNGWVSAADLQVSRLSMLWQDRLPAAVLSVVAGPPGMGKSTLEAVIAAELSREGHVGIISNLEDDPEAVTVPRLLAADADLSKVLLLRAESAPKLPLEFDKLAAMVRESGARFVILDPIAAHFHPERRLHDRGALAALMSLARECDCAIIGMHHTTKQGRAVKTLSAIEAIGGPQGGLSGAARAVYLYGFDPEDEDRRALACVKLNGMDRAATLIIEHETVELTAGGMCLEAGKLRFVGESNAAAEDVLSRGRGDKSRDNECAEWLTLYLASGKGCTRESKEVREEGVNVGFGWQTLQRAAVDLKIEKGKVGFGADQFWYWRLPEGHPMRRAAERGHDGPGS